jgi:hypothetical protein
MVTLALPCIRMTDVHVDTSKCALAAVYLPHVQVSTAYDFHLYQSRLGERQITSSDPWLIS